jgi:hypothetical protein
MKVSGQLYTSSVFTPDKEPPYPLKGRWVRLTAGLEK